MFYFNVMHIMFDTPLAPGKEVQGRHTGASGGPWCLSSDPCNVFPGVLEWECNMFHLKAGQTMLGEKQGELYEFELNTVVH